MVLQSCVRAPSPLRLQLPLVQGSESSVLLICSAPRNTKSLAGAGQKGSLSSQPCAS